MANHCQSREHGGGASNRRALSGLPRGSVAGRHGRAVTALAERLNETTIATLDHRLALA